MRHVEFVVYGVPIPKGSMRAFVIPGKNGARPRAIVTSSNAKVRPWQESVVDAAREALNGRARLEEPVALVAHFFLPRPVSAPRRVMHPAKKPDLDKLVRSIKDSLTRAGVYRDDNQVVVILARKEFAGGYSDPEGERGIPRASIEVGPFTEMRLSWGWPDQATSSLAKAPLQTLALFADVESRS